MKEEDLIKLIKTKSQIIEENLLLSNEIKEIKDELEKFLDEKLIGESLLALRYRKFKIISKSRVLWSDMHGFPQNGKDWIKPYVDFFEKFITEKKLINRLENEEFWVESRTQGNEQHLLIGKKDDSNGEKTHLILGETGEIRIDKKDKLPSELLRKVEAILTKTNGETIKSTIEFFKEIP